MKTAEVLIEWPIDSGKQEKVTLKRLNYGEKTELDTSCSEIKVIPGRDPIVSINQKKYTEQALIASITTAPFKLKDMEAIKSLSIEDGEKLFKKFMEMHEQSPSDNKKN